MSPDVSNQITALESALAALKATVHSGQASGSAGHDSGIATDDGAQTKGADMCRVTIFQDRKKWRVRVVDRETRRSVTHSYETEAEARAAAPKLQRQYTRPVGKPVHEAIRDYRARLEAKGNKPRSIETTLGRLQDVFQGVEEVVTGELTPEMVAGAFDRYATTPGRKSGKVPSVATRANTLNEARTFCRWLAEQDWTKAELLEGVKVEGRRKRRKPQLDRVEDARRFKAKALELATQGDQGATAALATLLLGLRASEVANTTVGDLDDGCRVWIVREAKTEAGDRRVMIPEDLRGLVSKLAAGKPLTAKLFGDQANRHWVLRSVQRVCREAGVPVISAHGMRGTHASLAVQAGVSGLAVAASLGHESFTVTERHYATPSSVATGRIQSVIEALN